jgi:hypothetical protein
MRRSPFPLRATNYQPTNTYMMMENNNNTKEKRNQPLTKAAK